MILQAKLKIYLLMKGVLFFVRGFGTGNLSTRKINAAMSLYILMQNIKILNSKKRQVILEVRTPMLILERIL